MKVKTRLIHDGKNFRGYIEDEATYEAVRSGRLDFTEEQKNRCTHYIIPANIFDRCLAMDRGMWISVKDKLPQKNERVICIFDEGDGVRTVCENTYIGGSVGWFQEGSKVTHWLPMPALPEDKEDEESSN